MRALFLIAIFSYGILLSVKAQYKRSEADIKASNTILFCNTTIEMGKNYQKLLKNYDNTIAETKQVMKELKENATIRVETVPCYDLSLPNKATADYEELCTLVTDFNSRYLIINTVEKAKKQNLTLTQHCNELHEYVNTCTFSKEADFERYDSLCYNLEHEVYNVWETWLEASRVASNVGGKYELLFLSRSKIGEFVVPMRKGMLILNDILHAIQYDQIDYDDVRQQLMFLEDVAIMDSNTSKKKKSKLKDKSYEVVYADFYMHYTETVAKLTELVDMLQSNSANLSRNEQYQAVNRNYKLAVQQYNIFAQQYAEDLGYK
ncbi:MAG: hypothetical protein RL662_611 [Bacteroidota bacterium]|jgi:hypothetical protein